MKMEAELVSELITRWTKPKKSNVSVTHVHNRLSPVTVQSQMKPNHVLRSCFH